MPFRVSHLLNKSVASAKGQGPYNDRDIVADCMKCAKPIILSLCKVQGKNETEYVCPRCKSILIIISKADPKATPWPGRGYRFGRFTLRNAVDLRVTTYNNVTLLIPRARSALDVSRSRFRIASNQALMVWARIAARLHRVRSISTVVSLAHSVARWAALKRAALLSAYIGDFAPPSKPARKHQPYTTPYHSRVPDASVPTSPPVLQAPPTIPIFNPQKAKVFPSIGRCIYCGLDGRKERLTREHIVPKGLSGAIIFSGASCEECRVITSKFEEDALSMGYKSFRSAVKFPMNKPVEITKPYWLVLPLMPRAGLLVKRKPTDDNLTTAVQRFWFDPTGSGHPSRTETPEFPIRSFIRMLAKIGHGIALGEVGAEGFVPFLPDLILWRNPKLIHHLVGCAEKELADSVPLGRIERTFGENQLKKPVKWDVHQIRVIATTDDGNRLLIVICIRLFAIYPTPLYEIVAGELLPSSPVYEQYARALAASAPQRQERYRRES